MSTSQPRITGLFVTLATLFIALLITSNIIAVKIIEVGGRIVPAAIVLFPLTYIIGDILTEVYGIRFARRVIWLGFLGNFVAVLGFWLGGLLPAAEFWGNDEAYNTILGATPRILAASLGGYLVGEFANSTVLSKLKLATNGRWLWMRTIGSTVVGQGLDSVVFISVAFIGTLGFGNLTELIVTQWLIKVFYETVATPLTYLTVSYVKKWDGIDIYDIDVSINPLDLR
ncbi:queuosine precursor transporter [SAR202 cluster bacterium AD-493-K16_JPT_193m]|nr:queuosine precursor transporter [SAR202 cluster bacterium AD-493-K16_JPT_193m]